MEIKSAKFVKGVVGEDEVLHDGMPQYAFIGRSNVGKSSLINAITDSNDMARVGKKPGKTTEINFFLINNSFYLVDLPGYGFAKASLAARDKLRKLIIWYLTESGARPQKVVLVVDSKVGMTDFDKDTLEVLKGEDHPFIMVANKIDKLTQSEASASIKAIQTIVGSAPVVPFSSQTKKGMDKLVEAIFL
jgi:GTP-binding protein